MLKRAYFHPAFIVGPLNSLGPLRPAVLVFGVR